MATGFVVVRTRVHDSSVAHQQMGAPSKVGQTRESKKFRTRAGAEREAAAWESTGDWSTVVEERF